MELTLTVHAHDARTVVAVAGDVDVITAASLRDRLERELAAGRTDLVLDLTQVGFLDSTGMSVLVGRLKHASHIGGRVVLVCPEGRVLQGFTITGLDRIFPIYATLDEALDDAAGERRPTGVDPLARRAAQVQVLRDKEKGAAAARRR